MLLTMRLSEVMAGIEEYRFSSELNLASGTKAFRRGLRNHRLVRALAEQAKDPVARSAVAKRIEDLAGVYVDPRYENRYDAALSAYLTVLSDVADTKTIAMAASAAMKAENTWWTGGISRELVTQSVATGLAEASAEDSHVVPAGIVAGVDWRSALPIGSSKLCSAKIPATARTVTEDRIVEALRMVEVRPQAQVPDANRVMVVPQPSDCGERVVWNKRGRNRTHGRARTSHSAVAPNGRTRQQARG